MLYCLQVLNAAEVPLKKDRVELEKTQKSATMMTGGREQLPYKKSLSRFWFFQLGKEMPERAVPQVYETMNGEQNLNEKWLFISFYNTHTQKKI